DAWEAAFTDDTRAAIVESIANPGAQLVDLPALSAVAHARDVPVVVDSTLASPALYRPGEHGADVVVHSATKYLCGHGTTIAGLIVDTGRFDPRRCPHRWPQLTERNRRFGVTFADEYARAGSGLLDYARAKYVTDFGTALPAASAHQILFGIETLDLRMRKISADTAALASPLHGPAGAARRETLGMRRRKISPDTAAVASRLRGRAGVALVEPPSLSGRADSALAARAFPHGTSAVFSLGLDGGEAAAAAFCDALSLWRIAVNIGDARSLVCHPASTTHCHLSDAQREACGVGPGTVRLSVGLEDLEDLWADLDQALHAARSAAGEVTAAA